MVDIPDLHMGEWGFDSPKATPFTTLHQNYQTLRAKITLFQQKDLHLNILKLSTNCTCLFKPKKFMVGHFDLGQHSCLRKD